MYKTNVVTNHRQKSITKL